MLAAAVYVMGCAANPPESAAVKAANAAGIFEPVGTGVQAVAM